MNNHKEIIKMCKAAGGIQGMAGRTVLGNEIPLLRKGKGKTRILLVASVHAREYITTPLVLNLFKRYNGDFPIDLVPVLNVDGVILSRTGFKNLDLTPENKKFLLETNGGSMDFSQWKANIRGVDLNTNFDASWGKGFGNLINAAPSGYIGAYPFSEPETQCIKRLILNNDYALVVAYHTKGEEVYWGFKDNLLYKNEAEAYAKYLDYKLKETPFSTGGLKDYYTLVTKRLGLTVECGHDSFSHPYPESELANLVKKHDGSIDLLVEIAKDLCKKYNS